MLDPCQRRPAGAAERADRRRGAARPAPSGGARMSGGVIYQEALRVVRRLGLPEQAEQDVVTALEAAQPGPLGLLYEAGMESGLRREMLLARGTGIFLSFAAGNLADDLCDGDCSYYPQPLKVGPYVQFLLQNL